MQGGEGEKPLISRHYITHYKTILIFITLAVFGVLHVLGRRRGERLQKKLTRRYIRERDGRRSKKKQTDCNFVTQVQRLYARNAAAYAGREREGRWRRAYKIRG